MENITLCLDSTNKVKIVVRRAQLIYCIIYTLITNLMH